MQVLIPIIANLLSLLFILSVCLPRALGSRNGAPTALHDGAAGQFEATHYRDDPASNDSYIEESIPRRTYDEPQSSLTEDHYIKSLVQRSRPRGQTFLILIEALIAICLILCHSIGLLKHVATARDFNASVVGLTTWCYILLLVSIRLLALRVPARILPGLWYHTAWLYGTYWIISALLLRSALIHPEEHSAQTLAIAEFCLVGVLALIAFTSRKGNRVVLLAHENDIEPSQEPLANLFSDWTYSWVNPIVWKGYSKTLELADVWNLEARDKAAVVLADFRQVQKTNLLALHLVKYFKRDLTIQALWAALAGLLTFAPTLLLKAFLEFVEDPTTTPVNAAWFYITLLAISSCAKSVADGKALWLGRKICIRLRAIVVGEIYAKALRRKASSDGESVLGSEKAHAKPQQHATEDLSSQFNAKVDEPITTGPSANSQANVGTIINLMAVDSFKVSEISAYLHFLWGSTPIQLIVCIILLYKILGLSSLAGIVLMVLALPLNLFIARQFSKTQKRVMAATDLRINTTNEILQNIRIIKYFAWEQRFSHIVGEKRDAEMRALRNKFILWTFAAAFWFGLPVLITFFSFLLYTIVEERRLIPSVAFPALSLFGILRYPLDQLADMVAHVQESKVSIDRVEEFLNEGETEKYQQLARDTQGKGQSGPIIGFDTATLSWGSRAQSAPENQGTFRMIGLNVRFVPGRLNIIAGPTGSGKTSMLMALLGEMTLLQGRVFLPCAGNRELLSPDPQSGLTESVAYCAQQAWLVNDSIRQNILFASPFDQNRYRAVLSACALERDLEILDNGDATLVGEKGITLSGGQKQRISLARALYCNSRHVLLDDCLSAVDSHTAKHIFEYCILGPLMYGRTSILVTHNIALCVPRSHFVIALNNGKIVAQGPPDDVITSGALGEDILKSRPGSKLASNANSGPPSRADLSTDIGSGDHQVQQSQLMNGSAKEHPHSEEAKMASSRLTEQKSTGSVNLKVIQLYMNAMGPWIYWLVALWAFILQQVGSVGANVWVRTWANSYIEGANEFREAGINVESTERHVTYPIGMLSSTLPARGSVWSVGNLLRTPKKVTPATVPGGVDAWHYLAIYAVLGVLFIMISIIREWLIFWGSLRASTSIHRKLFDAVTHAKLQFFDTTPLGQLMNRFSKDIEALDQDLSPITVGVLGCFFSLISIVVLICVITPRFLIAGFFILIIYFAIGSFYLCSSRDLKRLESVQRSPIYQQFGETLTGAVTIRAYGDEKRFTRDNQLRVDTHNRPFIYLWATNRWLALRVDFAGALVAFFAGLFVILSIGTVDAGSAGLSLTYAVMFTENVLWLVRLYSANEQNMNAVERIKEYMETDQEAQAIIAESRPPATWPSQGAIEFQKYTTRYRPDLEPVLSDLTFNVLPGERVGIVGRTGAGKSSLALALFRGLEASNGSIFVDDIDISSIGLQDLREAITIVPQDPTLFTGTVRSNLDPFGLFTDEEIFLVLRRVQLIEPPSSASSSSASLAPPVTITPPDTPSSSSSPQTNPQAEMDLAKKDTNTRDNMNIFTDLSSRVAESGSNLSQGQRQLLCLARALLKAPRVLVMDEATASIDYATDAKIQQTLRDVKDTTIITIAHRLQTIVDYDKILVLDKGCRVEFDAPWVLLELEDGIFRGMCEMSGELDMLFDIAREAGKKKALVET